MFPSNSKRFIFIDDINIAAATTNAAVAATTNGDVAATPKAAVGALLQMLL